MHDYDTNVYGASQADSARISTSHSDPRKTLKMNERHIAVGKALLAQICAQDKGFISTPNGPLLYSDGSWRRLDKKWLAVQIEIACIGLGFNSNTKLVNETRAWLLRQPELWQDRAPQSRVRP